MTTTTVDETGKVIEETPLVVTSQVGTDVVARKVERSDTAYVVLQLGHADDGNGGEEEAWLIASESIQARSAEAAVRTYVEGMKADKLGAHGVTLVAVPVRSWKPVVVKPQTVTTLVIEEA